MLMGLSGCGSAFYAGDQLEALLGIQAVPTDPAFEYRWYQGPGEGLVVGCELVPAEGIFEEEALFGELRALPMDDPEPAAWFTLEDGTRVAIGFMALVDAANHEPFGGYPDAEAVVAMEEEEEEDEDTGFELEGLGTLQLQVVMDQWSDVDVDRGVWGFNTRHAVFVVEDPESEALGTLMVGGEVPGRGLSDRQLVRWAGDLVDITGGLQNALYLPRAEAEDLEEDGLPVQSMAYVSDQHLRRLFGLSFGGAEPAEDCP